MHTISSLHTAAACARCCRRHCGTGIMASDLDVHVSTAVGTLGGSSGARVGASSSRPCAVRRRPARLSLWPPLPNLLTNMACFSYLMVPVPCMRGGRLSLCDQPGIDMRVNAGGRDGTDALTFRKGGYAQLTEFLVQELGYRCAHGSSSLHMSPSSSIHVALTR